MGLFSIPFYITITKSSTRAPSFSILLRILGILGERASLAVLTTRQGDKLWDYALYLTISLTFPNSLVVPSLYALITTSSTMILASTIGRWIDNTPRLKFTAVAIVTQNASS